MGDAIMQGQVAVVTGGGRGIGRAICRRLASAGASVVAASRTRDDLAETKRLVEADGGACTTCVTNVESAEEIDALVSQAVSTYGGIDLWVNNAGLALHGPIDTLEPARLDRMIAVNVSAVLYGCRAVWPVMRERGGGVIVNISSMAGVDPFPGFAAYGATKTFVDGLTRGLAAEGAEHGIRVYAVAPGAVDTAMLRGPFPDFPDDQCLQPEEVAEMVWLMAQPACRHSAGQTVYVRRR